MILGANHVALSVPDLDKGVAFYCDQLGFKRMFGFGWVNGDDLSGPVSTVIGAEGTSCNAAMLSCGNLLLEMFHFTGGDRQPPQPQDPKRPVIDHGITHLCLAVKDVQGEYERLVAAGMEFFSEPTTLVPGITTVYGRDPFGNVIELEEVEGRETPAGLQLPEE